MTDFLSWSLNTQLYARLVFVPIILKFQEKL
jgi:hypothetical protein